MLAYLACEVEESEVLHPVVVVDELGLVRLVAVEVEELSHLFLNGLLIVVECLRVEQVTLLAFARRVANHTRCTAYKEVWLVATTLEVAQHHDAAEVSDVK